MSTKIAAIQEGFARLILQGHYAQRDCQEIVAACSSDLSYTTITTPFGSFSGEKLREAAQKLHIEFKKGRLFTIEVDKGDKELVKVSISDKDGTVVASVKLPQSTLNKACSAPKNQRIPCWPALLKPMTIPEWQKITEFMDKVTARLTSKVK